MTSRPRTRIATGAALVAAGLVGTTLVVGGGGSAQAAELTAFGSCAELERWYADAALPSVGPWGLDGGYGFAEEEVAMSADARGMDMEASAPAGDAAVGNGATGTNVQEQGVDEPDVAKTDGRLLVTVVEDTLHVVDVSGAQARSTGRLRLDGIGASDLLLVGDRAVVLGTRYDTAGTDTGGGDAAGTDAATTRLAGPMWDVQRAVLTVVDLSDPAEPTVLRTEEVDGGVLTAREHGGLVRIVVSHSPMLRFEQPAPGPDGMLTPAAEQEATERNREVVTSATAQDWLPQRLVRDAAGEVVEQGPLVRCGDVRHPSESAGTATLAVLTLDPRSAAPAASTAVTASGDLVYASADRLYVATSRGGWWPMAPAIDVGRPMPMPGGRQLPAPDTQLHAFDITGTTAARYVASGSVDGTVIGQWAFSEHEGRLRVATTRDPGDRPSDSAVTVLEERDDRLVEIGSVGGLGRDERIQAVRWFDDLAVVVTFRETDPLHTVDLSDPAAPRVRGELKIPGFSAYLHPVGGDLLLGVGQDATGSGETLGAQVSAFDLSDLDRPGRVATHDLGRGTWSEVQGDSRAFTYLPERRTAVLPVESMGARYESALVALRVGADGALQQAGSWSPGTEASASGEAVRRALPLDGDRIAAVTWSTVTVLDADGLAQQGDTVRLR